MSDIATTRDILRDPLVNLQLRIEEHLAAIEKMFKRPPKITIVIRTPWIEDEGKDGDVLLSNDDFDMAIAAINRLKIRQPVAALPEKETDGKG